MRRISLKWKARFAALAFVGIVALAIPSFVHAEGDALCWWECDQFFCRYVCAA